MNQRVFGYDLIKALAMLMVVFYHIANIDLGECMHQGDFSFTLSKFLYGLLAAGVPLFFMVNGAVSANREQTLHWSLTKFFRLLWVAFFWTIIIRCIIYPCFFGIPRLDSVIAFRNFYWFLFTLAFIYPIAYVFQKYNSIRNIVLLVLLIIPFLSNFCWDLALFFGGKSIILPSWGHTGFLTLYSLVYYYLGRFFSRQHIHIVYSVVLVLVGLLFVNFEVYVMSNYYHDVYDGVNACFPTIGALLMSIGIFFLFKDYHPRTKLVSKVISVVGRNTLGIYIYHLLALPIIGMLVTYDGLKPPLLVFIEALFVSFICAFLSHFLNKSPLSFLLKL